MNVGTNILALSLGAVAVASISAWTSTRGKVTRVNDLPWFNRYEDAVAAAKRADRPILLLSMFGQIDEKLPCANARTLRATLFKSPEFAKLAREKVILAWEMVRPVPHITIDLGDGKKVERTVRGNAVMYLCNPDGKVIDAFPGIYTVKDFAPIVNESIDKLAHSSDAEVIAYHRTRAGVPRGDARTTVGKSFMESPSLEMMGQPMIAGQVTPIPVDSNPAKLLFLQGAMMLSDQSLTPMSADQVLARTLPDLKDRQDPAKVAAVIMAEDSMRNLRAVRPVVHSYFASESTLPTPAQARDAVLGTILHIPYKDPYMGLREVLLPGTPD